MNAQPCTRNQFHLSHCQLLARSYFKLTGKLLGNLPIDDPDLGQKFHEGNFIVVSHGTEDDPVFNYGNIQALNLFEMDWDSFTQLPSRKSAEQPNREERAKLLAEVTRNGFIDDYSGIRIASSGQRFVIRNALVWNVTDDEGQYLGQAATFDQWEYL